MDDVGCTTTERKLIDCPFTLNHDCSHGEDAGVRCFSTTSGNNFNHL
jgi:deleted-in-malignant-brain-tumors protein 1